MIHILFILRISHLHIFLSNLCLLYILTRKVCSILYKQLLYNYKPAVAQYVPKAKINISVPLNTQIVKGTATHVNICLALDISFQDFLSCVCACMDLDPLEAYLGYKFHTDRVQDPSHWLFNEKELRFAMSHGAELIKHARTCTISLEIHNLVCCLYPWSQRTYY